MSVRAIVLVFQEGNGISRLTLNACYLPGICCFKRTTLKHEIIIGIAVIVRVRLLKSSNSCIGLSAGNEVKRRIGSIYVYSNLRTAGGSAVSVAYKKISEFIRLLTLGFGSRYEAEGHVINVKLKALRYRGASRREHHSKLLEEHFSVHDIERGLLCRGAVRKRSRKERNGGGKRMTVKVERYRSSALGNVFTVTSRSVVLK